MSYKLEKLENWKIYKGLTMKRSRKLHCFKTSLQKNQEADFFGNIFRRKCSLGSCATFSENMVYISIVGLEKFVT